LTTTTTMQPPLLQLIVFSFHLPPLPEFWPTRLNNRDVNDTPIPSPIRSLDIHAGPWCPMTTLPHSSSSSSPLRSRSFAEDDEGKGTGGTATSHVVATAPVVVHDRVVGGDCVGLNDTDDIWSVTWPCPPH
jgi:hypothetical protein